MKYWPSVKKLLLFLIMVFVFHGSFHLNLLGLQAAGNSFEDFEVGCEETVMRLMEETVRMGRVGMGDYLLVERTDDSGGTDLSPYYSSFGLQGILFGAVTLRRGGEVERTAEQGRFYVSLVTAALMSLFGLLVLKEFGWPALLLYVAGSVLSVWLVFAARNIYLMFFLKMLPFLLTMLLFPFCMDGPPWRFAALAVLVGVSTLAASLCLFDYISNTVLSVAVAPIYFGVSRGRPRQDILRWARGLLLAAIVAAALAVVAVVVKAGIAKGSFGDGFREIAIAATSRSFGTADLQRAAGMSLGEVWEGYWPMPLLAWPRQTPDHYQTYFSVFALLAAWVLLTALAFLDGRRFPAFEARRPQLVALSAATGWALLAAVSWGVLMKGHMARHYHINGMMFSIPYLPMLFIFIGTLLSVAWRQTVASARKVLVSLSESAVEEGHDHE